MITTELTCSQCGASFKIRYIVNPKSTTCPKCKAMVRMGDEPPSSRASAPKSASITRPPSRPPPIQESRIGRFAVTMTMVIVVLAIVPGLGGFLLLMVLPSIGKLVILAYLFCVAANAFVLGPIAVIALIIAAVTDTNDDRPSYGLRICAVLLLSVGGFVVARMLMN